MSNRCIELHDSEIAEISPAADGKMIVRFSSAYIHESHKVPGIDGGKGFVQEADLIVTEGKVAGNLPRFPTDISDGSIVLNRQRVDNIIPIPFDFIGEFSIGIVFVSGDNVQIRGTGAKLVLHGEPVYVEEFPFG